MQALRRQIVREDKTYRAAKRSLDNLKETFDPKKILDELFNLQASRAVSALNPQKILQSALHKLLKAEVQELAVRSRATVIKMAALRNLLHLEQIIDPLRKYLLITYRNELKDEGITGVGNQKAAVDDVMKSFLREKLELDYIVKITDLVLEDTTSAGFALKRIQETLNTASRDR